MIKWILLMILCIPLYGCGIGERPANELYVLKTDMQSGHRKTVPINIRIAEPEMAPGLDTDRIAVMSTPNQLTYYTGAAWAQPLPQILQQFLMNTFQQSRTFKGVDSEQESITPDVILLTEIQDYEVNNNVSPPTVRVRLTAKLVNANHKLLATIPIEKTEVAEVNHMPAIIAAFNKATDEVATDLLHWVGKHCTGENNQ